MVGVKTLRDFQRFDWVLKLFIAFLTEHLGNNMMVIHLGLEAVSKNRTFLPLRSAMSSPNVRSAVALRSAGSVLICWVFGTMAAVSFKHVSHLMVALACVVSFATPMNLLGDSCRNAFIWASSITVLTPVGLGCCYLCFLIGGLQWNLWILAVGLGGTVLLGVLWSFSAAHLHSPRMMLAGNSATVVICILPPALVLGGLKDHVQLLVSLAGLVTAIFIGALLPLIISHLPYIGAQAASAHVPRAAAKKLAALADLWEAVAIYPLPTAAALHRHRECRLRCGTCTGTASGAVG
eukprot:s557_g3.t1